LVQKNMRIRYINRVRDRVYGDAIPGTSSHDRVLNRYIFAGSNRYPDVVSPNRAIGYRDISTLWKENSSIIWIFRRIVQRAIPYHYMYRLPINADCPLVLEGSGISCIDSTIFNSIWIAIWTISRDIVRREIRDALYPDRLVAVRFFHLSRYHGAMFFSSRFNFRYWKTRQDKCKYKAYNDETTFFIRPIHFRFHPIIIALLGIKICLTWIHNSKDHREFLKSIVMSRTEVPRFWSTRVHWNTNVSRSARARMVDPCCGRWLDWTFFITIVF